MQFKRRGSPLHRLTYCRENPSCDCGPSEQGFVVDAFNTQMFSLAQSGCALSSSERDLQMQSTSKEKSNVES
jgi:hypothetical protein